MRPFHCCWPGPAGGAHGQLPHALCVCTHARGAWRVSCCNSACSLWPLMSSRPALPGPHMPAPDNQLVPACSSGSSKCSWSKTGGPSVRGWWPWRAAKRREQPACRCGLVFVLGCRSCACGGWTWHAKHALCSKGVCVPCCTGQGNNSCLPSCVARPAAWAGGAVGARADAAGARLPAGGAAPRGAGHV